LLFKFHEMKKEYIMFNKTLLAVSVFALASTANAASIRLAQDDTAAFAAVTPSTQAVSTADLITVAAPILHLDANYGAGDTITVTYSGAALDEDYSHPTTALTIGATAGGTCATGSQAVSFAGLSGSVATYTFGASDGTTVGCTVELPAVQVDGASLGTADKFNIAVTTSRGFGSLETVAATALVDVGVDVITVVATTPFNDKIDVNDNRNSFLGGTEDELTITLADTDTDTVGADLAATSTMSLAGDFSWAKTVAADASVSYPAVTMKAAGTGVDTGFTVTDTTASWVATTAGTYIIVLTPPTAADDLRTLKASTYTLSTVLKFDNGEDVIVRSQAETDAAGSHALNGASITAYGIPNSAAVTPFLWVQNSGTQSGAVSVDVRCEGVTTTGIDAGTSAAGSNTKIDAAVQAAVDDVATCLATSRYDAVVTVNAPVDAITVNAGYRVTAADGSNDRLSLETSDSLDGDGY
jgi:hypothetical protein